MTWTWALYITIQLYGGGMRCSRARGEVARPATRRPRRGARKGEIEMSPKLRMAFLGCGRICQVHWNGIQESASELITVCAAIDLHLPRAQEMAQKLQDATGEPCEAFTSLAEALDSEVKFDAVDIMLLHNQHEAAALEAFAAGLDVVLEKPMSISPESCGKITQAAEVAGNTFWVAEQEQYAPAILTAQRLITEGEIGDTVTLHTMGAGGGGRHDPTAVQTDSLGRRVIGQGAVVKAAGLPAYYEPMEGEDKFRTGKLDKAWRSDKSIAGGGVIIDGGSHTIRPMRMLMQPHCGNLSSRHRLTSLAKPRKLPRTGPASHLCGTHATLFSLVQAISSRLRASRKPSTQNKREKIILAH
jgi:predicted dehydrogenase